MTGERHLHRLERDLDRAVTVWKTSKDPCDLRAVYHHGQAVAYSHAIALIAHTLAMDELDAAVYRVTAVRKAI